MVQDEPGIALVTQAPPISHPVGRSSVRWVILALLFLASFVAYVLRTNMSVAGETMMKDLGFSQIQLGFVLAAFAWGYAIFQFPGGVFGDRIGGRKALTYIAIAWGVLNLLTGLVPDASVVGVTGILAILMLLRFLMGAVQAPLYPVTGGGTTCNWFPVTGWALPNGLSNTGLTLGAAATGPLIAWLIEREGWRASFFLTAPLGLLIAAVWYWYARDRPSEHPKVSESELALINEGRTANQVCVIRPGAWKQVVRHREIVLLAASYFCSNYVFYFFFNWLFIYLVDSRGFKVLEGGFYSAAPWLTGAVGATAGGILADSWSKRWGIRQGTRTAAVAGLLVSAVLIVAAAMARDPVTAVVFLSLCLAGQQFAEGAFWAATISASGPHASAGCGVLNTGGNVVGGIGALMVPLTVKFLGWPTALATGSVFAIFAALLWFFIKPENALKE
jgi:ACS family glucarate transporter-like MFS transporter